MACLRATIFRIEIPSKNPRSDEFKKEIGKKAQEVKVKEFVADESATKEIQASVDKENKEKDQEENKAEEEEKNEIIDDIDKLKEEFIAIYKTIKIPKSKSYEDIVVKAEEFEKDDDANYHIDFMSSMGNCRALSYKLEPMDWLQVKLKAGRIVPAMATTTASIAGLQTLELVKLLKGVKKEDHRNAFLNLAVPIMQATEPGDVIKTKLTEKLETSLWDRWDIEAKDATLQEVIKKFEEKYEGLEVRDVLKGNAPIYFHAIMSAPGKEKDKETTLKSKLVDLLEDVEGEQYVDLTVTCVTKNDKEGNILEGVPPLRVQL